MSKLKVSNTKFYTQEEELRSGYLHKSPGPLISMKSQKSWKRRFFVLFKTSEGVYTLKYFRSEERNKALGEIDLLEISTLLFCPESHSMWGCIHKMFRCPASCVLLLRANSRDYFLVGENSWETNGWFDVLYNVLYDQDVDVGKPRTCSAPPLPRTEQTHQASDREAKSKSMPPLSQPVKRPVCLMPPYRPNTQASLIEATGPSAAEEHIYAVPSSLPVIAALQNVDEGPRRTQSEPPKSWTNKKTELIYDKKVRPKSMPLAPPSLPRDTSPARLFAVHEKASPQVPKSDENEEGADCGIYEDMATLCNAAMKAEDKEPSEDVDSEDSDFFDDGQPKNSPTMNRPTMTDEKGASCQILPTPIEMEVCVSREDLEKHLDLTSDGETPGRDSLLLKGDEILAINNLHIDSEEEVEFMLKKLRVNEVTLTIRRLSSEFQP
ncbi:pleckstrin homology domain-containing family S member 1-like isoform X2 [Sardina pilchardus]|uniref:pleckstrin homology domain-containing family S member 1-like isoform X2 n=1 Tax=Sardina pilchardus TaxID=27697 RepID=UPI002E117C6F